MILTAKIKSLWIRFWMRLGSPAPLGRLAMRLAALPVPPFYSRLVLAGMNPNGYISPHATIHHSGLSLGKNVYIDDGVLIYQDKAGGNVVLGDGVHLHRDIIIQTGQDGSVKIGPHTHIQPRCQFSAYKSPIQIGIGVEIAPYCAFYPYNHGFKPGEPIRNQPLQSKGGITIEDDVWLSVGVVVLDGVRIGKGAVVGAGAVVTQNIPADAIAVGNPARVVKMRGDLSLKDSKT